MIENDIPGIPIRAFPLSEALIKCTFTISYGNAIEITKKAKTGLYINDGLWELMRDKIGIELEKIIKERKNNE